MKLYAFLITGIRTYIHRDVCMHACEDHCESVCAESSNYKKNLRQDAVTGLAVGYVCECASVYFMGVVK